MKAIKVEYTVRQEFAETNKANIQKVIDDLRATSPTEVQYSSWIKDDGKSFVHIFISVEGAENPLSTLDSFKEFQAQLKEHVEVPPQVTELAQVGTSFEL